MPKKQRKSPRKNRAPIKEIPEDSSVQHSIGEKVDEIEAKVNDFLILSNVQQTINDIADKDIEKLHEEYIAGRKYRASKDADKDPLQSAKQEVILDLQKQKLEEKGVLPKQRQKQKMLESQEIIAKLAYKASLTEGILEIEPSPGYAAKIQQDTPQQNKIEKSQSFGEKIKQEKENKLTRLASF